MLMAKKKKTAKRKATKKRKVTKKKKTVKKKPIKKTAKKPAESKARERALKKTANKAGVGRLGDSLALALLFSAVYAAALVSLGGMENSVTIGTTVAVFMALFIIFYKVVGEENG